MRLNQEEKKEYYSGLYHRNFDYVYAFIFTRTAGSRQLTEDIVQETFAAAWTSLDRFDNKSSGRTWLCAIAKNKLRAHYRKTLRKEKFEYPDSDGLAEYADSFSLERIALENETRQRVIEVLNELNSLYRFALIMKYLDGLSVKEIAEILGRTEKAVDGVLQRAKAGFEKAFVKSEGLGVEHE